VLQLDVRIRLRERLERAAVAVAREGVDDDLAFLLGRRHQRRPLRQRLGARTAPFEYRNPDGLDPDAVPVERVSVRYLQEKARTKAAR